MSNDSSRQISSIVESITALALRIGAVAAGIGLVYILYVVFGHKLAEMPGMKAADRDSFVGSVGIARAMFTYGSVAVIASLCVRFFHEETIGLILALVGAAVYFFSPGALGSLTLGAFRKNPLYTGIVSDFTVIGLVCLIPGCLLLVRDVIVRIANRFGTRYEVPGHNVEEGHARKGETHKPYEKCWDMALCNERSKRFCTAWEKRKPCWQVKSGCLCDQDIIRQALLERDREQHDAVQTPQAADTRPKIVLSPQQKKARCRACTIYTEHQRQKFRIASPVIMVAVALIYAGLYGRIAGVLYGILERTDRFMSFMTYRHGANASFASQGHIVTTLAMICIGVVLLSFTLRALEYLIFDLQI